MRLNESGRLWAPVAAGDAVATAVMHAHNTNGEGPCLDVLRDDKQVIAEDLTTDLRWPKFSAEAATVGIRSMVCTPMSAGGRKLGLPSLMTTDPHFVADQDTPAMAGVFAAHAAVAMAMAGVRRVQDINGALTSRDVIGKAKGIVMERFKVTPEVAFAMLVRTSCTANMKLRDVCDQLCLTGIYLPDPPRPQDQRKPRT